MKIENHGFIVNIYTLQNSHILRLEAAYSILTSGLLSVLDKKSCGLLEPVTGPGTSSSFTPLVVIMSQNSAGATMLAAFCVDSGDPGLDRAQLYSSFTSLFRENVKYEMVKSVVTEMLTHDESLNVKESECVQDSEKLKSPEKIPEKSLNVDTKTIKLLKDKIKDLLPKPKNKSSDPDSKIINLSTRSQALWETFVKEKKISSIVTFAVDEKTNVEYFVFSALNSTLEKIKEKTLISFESKSEDETSIEVEFTDTQEAALQIRTLSSLEQYFLLMGSQQTMESGPHLIVESHTFQNIFEQFETKHKSRIIVVPKLEQENPYVFCSVEPSATWDRVEAAVEKELTEGTESDIKPNLKRKHHNPDEIIDGRPKWSKIKVLHGGGRNGADDIKEESLDFDRLNPHRSFVPEFEDQFENTDWVYNHTVLKMLADLNSETAVVLGNNRLDPGTCKNCPYSPLVLDTLIHPFLLPIFQSWIRSTWRSTRSGRSTSVRTSTPTRKSGSRS